MECSILLMGNTVEMAGGDINTGLVRCSDPHFNFWINFYRITQTEWEIIFIRRKTNYIKQYLLFFHYINWLGFFFLQIMLSF